VRGRWVRVRHLRVGDSLISQTGQRHLLTRIDAKPEHATVYNFTVQDLHTYFVGQERILTHNTACPPVHKNSNSAVGRFGIYRITIDGKLYKIGKADLGSIVKSSGDPLQLRKLRKANPGANVEGAVTHDLGITTTWLAKEAENAAIRNVYNATGQVPPGNQNSFTP
jgi:hypothetical protein